MQATSVVVLSQTVVNILYCSKPPLTPLLCQLSLFSLWCVSCVSVWSSHLSHPLAPTQSTLALSAALGSVCSVLSLGCSVLGALHWVTLYSVLGALCSVRCAGHCALCWTLCPDAWVLCNLSLLLPGSCSAAGGWIVWLPHRMAVRTLSVPCAPWIC